MKEIHVQTLVSEATYEALARAAKRGRRPIKAVVKEAVEAYVQRETPLEEDSLFRFVGSVRSKEGNWSTRKDWRA